MTHREYIEQIPFALRTVFVVNIGGSNGLAHLGRLCDCCRNALILGSHYVLPAIMGENPDALVRHDGCAEWIWREEWRAIEDEKRWKALPTAWSRILDDDLV